MAANAGDIPGSAPVLPVECAVNSTHSIRLRGETIRYTATAGYLIIQDDQDRPTARIFYVAYVKPGGDRRSRPITFLFNGGPGCASLWVNVDSFGPVRIETGPAEGPRLVPNEFSLLDATDLVFIDAPMTGYSRLTGNSRPADFCRDRSGHPSLPFHHRTVPDPVRPLDVTEVCIRGVLRDRASSRAFGRTASRWSRVTRRDTSIDRAQLQSSCSRCGPRVRSGPSELRRDCMVPRQSTAHG